MLRRMDGKEGNATSMEPNYGGYNVNGKEKKDRRKICKWTKEFSTFPLRL